MENIALQKFAAFFFIKLFARMSNNYGSPYLYAN